MGTPPTREPERPKLASVLVLRGGAGQRGVQGAVAGPVPPDPTDRQNH